MSKHKRIALPLVSFLILWTIEAFKNAGILEGLGSATVLATVGIVIGGLVLFNILLFLYNVFKPENRLSFSIYDKITVGLWFMIVLGFFNFI